MKNLKLAHAQPLATNVPEKVKKTASDVLAAQLLQALSESQATAQQIIQDMLTTLQFACNYLDELL